jgi:sulfhydrogenase subunit alpha
VAENRRFYEEAVKAQFYVAVPQIVSRICGTCSIAHLISCIEAVEKTLAIAPSAQTILRRKLAMYSLMIRDHALHLYFFALPDVLGVDSVLDLLEDEKEAKKIFQKVGINIDPKELIHQALHIKEAGNNLSNLIAGRAVHAPFMQVGGFSQEIDATKIAATIQELKNIRQYAMNLAEIFYSAPAELKRDVSFVALAPDDFSFLEGQIKSVKFEDNNWIPGAAIEEKDYWDHLHNVVIPYSQGSGFEFEGTKYMVGSLARLNLNRNNLHTNTKIDAKKYLDVFPSNNIYHNNLAQAIEILHSIDHTIELLEKTVWQKEEIIKPSKLDGEGVGVIEAPRGTLYYWMAIKNGKISYANLVIPTSQNILNMRDDIKAMVEKICASTKQLGKKHEEIIRQEAEKIIRAYDPCMSCASHFLKINWE